MFARFVQFIAILWLGVAVLSAASDIAGKWHFVMSTPGGDREASATFKADGEQVSGKWDTSDVKGTFKDGSLVLVFPFTSAEAGVTADFTIKGTLKDGKLAGTWQFGEWAGEFTATREP